MKNKIYNIFIQLIESYLMFFVCFYVLVFFNNIYSKITFLDFKIYKTPQLYILTPLVIFIISKIWYMFFKERHSFVMIVTTFFINSYFMYQFGGLQDFLWFIIKEADIGIKALVFLMSLAIVFIEFILLSLLLANIHSLFTDRLQINNLGGNNDNCKSKKCRIHH